jgi:hypothetical protein
MSRNFLSFIGIYPFRSRFSKRNDFFSQKDTVKYFKIKQGPEIWGDDRGQGVAVKKSSGFDLK